MKTVYLIIILGMIITSSIIFAMLFEYPFEKEHYDIEIAGLKDAYLVGEPYLFSYAISGYGYPCTNLEIAYPDENGNTFWTGADADCNTGASKTKFVIDSKDNFNLENINIKNPGTYVVGVTFGSSTGFEPTQASDGFFVVERICDESKPKDRAQCFADAFDSCTSAFVEMAFPTGEGDGILITGVVESWYECTLRVHTDHTQDRHKGHSDGTRSICDGLSINEESIIFENCSNEDIPPLRFDQQYYLHKEKCEIHGGYWNFDFATCFDFSDEYDCKEMGGKHVDRGYTSNPPDYSKKSDGFACEFVK